MLRRMGCVTVLLGMLASGAAGGIFDKMAIGFYPGAVTPMEGRYRDSSTVKDMLLTGPGFGFGLRYKLNDHFFVDGNFSYSWMYFKANRRPANYVSDKPAFVVPMYMLNLAYYPMSGGFVEPYITVGGGICPWWFSSKPFGGFLLKSPGNPKKAFTMLSKAVNAGLGFEFMLGRKVSFLAEGKYYRIFARNEKKFGTGMFGNQDVLGLRLGFTFYFHGKHASATIEEVEQ